MKILEKIIGVSIDFKVVKDSVYYTKPFGYTDRNSLYKDKGEKIISEIMSYGVLDNKIFINQEKSSFFYDNGLKKISNEFLIGLGGTYDNYVITYSLPDHKLEVRDLQLNKIADLIDSNLNIQAGIKGKFVCSRKDMIFLINLQNKILWEYKYDTSYITSNGYESDYKIRYSIGVIKDVFIYQTIADWVVGLDLTSGKEQFRLKGIKEAWPYDKINLFQCFGEW